MSFNKFLDAVRNGDFNTLQMEYRSEFLNKKDENGNSAIQLAVLNSNLEMIKSLIHLGCDLDCTTEDYKTLVNLANQTDMNVKIEKILKNYKIAKSMNLSCNDNCDHNFCLISFCFNEFKEGELVDKGRHGKITKVQDSNSHQIFAIKRISWKPVRNDEGKALNEAKYVENNINYFKSTLIHKRMVHYYGASIEGCRMFIFMEYLSGGSIFKLIDEEFNDGLPCEKVLKYTQHILEGLEFLHSKKIIHRDIKPGNVLLDGNDNCKLTDFGFSRLIETIEKFTNSQYMESKRRKKLQEANHVGNENKKAKTQIGTANYMTPEMIKGQSYSTECDIWSLGATVYHMYFGKPPFYGEKQNSVFMKLGKNEKPIYPDKVNPDKVIISLLDAMLVIDQNKRPTATDLLKKYFKEI